MTNFSENVAWEGLTDLAVQILSFSVSVFVISNCVRKRQKNK